MSDGYDVVIVGAGPAGSTLAALLASRGVSVALLERDFFPRDKLCGEFLSYDAVPIVEHLGVSLEGAPTIESCRIRARSHSYEFDLPAPARGISRLRLDASIARAAVKAGAALLERCVLNSVSSENVVTSERELHATAVVGAWGRWGRFDQQLRRPFVRDRSHRSFGFKRHYVRRETSASAGSAIDLYSFSRGYLGVNEIESGLTNICGLVHDSRLAGHRGRWEAFVTSLRREDPQLDRLFAEHEPEQETFLSSEPVIFRARSSVESGIFMIGDASGVIDPFTGNGMAMAIQSALALAPLIVQLVAGTIERGETEGRYRLAHQSMFGPRIRWSRSVARILSRPLLLDNALRAVRSKRAGELFLAKTRARPEAVLRMLDEWTRRSAV